MNDTERDAQTRKILSTKTPPTNTNLPYLIAIVIMAFIGVCGVVSIIILRPTQDNAALFVAIAGFVGPTTAGLMAFIKAQETHLVVNSRMDEFKELLSKASKEETDSAIDKINQGSKES